MVKPEEAISTSALLNYIQQNPEEFTEEKLMRIAGQIVKWANILLEAEAAGDRNTAVKELYDAVDDFQNEFPEDEKKKITCRKGCAFCCHIQVTTTDIEKDVILEYVKEHGIKYNTNRLEDQLGLDAETHHVSDNSRCVFLGNQNTCNIYPVRPMVCRKYHVYSPPKFCDAKKYTKKPTMVHFHFHTEILASALLTASRKHGSMAEVLLDKIKEKGVIRSLPATNK